MTLSDGFFLTDPLFGEIRFAIAGGTSMRFRPVKPTTAMQWNRDGN